MPLDFEIKEGARAISTVPDFEAVEETQKLLRLNLAGQGEKEGFEDVPEHRIEDLSDFSDDSRGPSWGIQTDSVYEIFCANYVHRCPDLIGLLQTCYRILTPNGTLTIVSPHQRSDRAVADPRTRRQINEYTFTFFDRLWCAKNKIQFNPKCDFSNVSKPVLIVADEWVSRGDEAKKWALKNLWNTVTEVQFRLRAHKPMREVQD